MADVQLEHGHIRIANEWLEAAVKQRLAGREWDVLLTIARLTWGWQRKSELIGSRQIAQLTAIHDRDVRRILNTLRGRKMIARKREGKKRYRYGIRKDFEQWKPKQGVQTPHQGPTHENRGSGTPHIGGLDTPGIGGLETPILKERKKERKQSRHTSAPEEAPAGISQVLRTLYLESPHARRHAR